MKTIIERGASWTLEETKLLLALWGQDLVQRQQTNLKRTKEVYEKIAEKFNQNGFERTSDQVRTRVFNMIAEYRRILKDPSPERMKKCIFFDALHKIYQAKHMDDVKSALDDYEPECPYSPASNTIMSERGDESISDSEAAVVLAAADGDNASTGGTNRNIKSVSTSGSKNINNNNIHSSADTANNSTNIDLQEENNCTSRNDNNNTHDANNGTQNSSLPAAANATSIATNDNDSNVKHFKIRTQNNEVMLLKVIDGEAAPSLNSKKLKLEPYKTCGCDINQDGKQIHKSSCTHYNTNHLAPNSAEARAWNKQQSLLMPHASNTAGPSSSSASLASVSTPVTTKPGNSNSAYISINNAKIPIVRSNGINVDPSGNNNLTSTPTRLHQPITATVASHHQLYQAPVNTFDVTSSALLIDRMFAHLSRESENMREWIALEKERLALERAKKAQETEREIRRERVLIDTLMRFQEQWISFIAKLDPRIVENAPEPPPELKFPSSRDSSNTSADNNATTSHQTSTTGTTTTRSGTSTTNTSTTSSSASQSEKTGAGGNASGGATSTAASAHTKSEA